MPAKDLYHDAVKNALINDGWIITADPYIIKYEDAELYADLSAEKPIAAERQDQKIVVEIKSFVGKSMMYDFHNALGQYIVYRNLIQLTEPEYIIYLAIDQSSVHRLDSCGACDDRMTAVSLSSIFSALISASSCQSKPSLVNRSRHYSGDNCAMDKLESYRNTIKAILEQYYQVTITQSHVMNNSEVSDRLALDENRDQYLWFRFGWDNSKLVQYIILYFCIKDNKIWVEIDATDLCVVDDLLAAGVPADDIVLGFHPPHKRQLTEFAHAQPSI